MPASAAPIHPWPFSWPAGLPDAKVKDDMYLTLSVDLKADFYWQILAGSRLQSIGGCQDLPLIEHSVCMFNANRD